MAQSQVPTVHARPEKRGDSSSAAEARADGADSARAAQRQVR